MIKLDKIKIKNFKNIKSAELAFDKYNLIVGPNNSGKTNLLKILSCLDFIINGSLDDVKCFFTPSGLSSLGIMKPCPSDDNNDEIEIEIKFSDSNVIYSYLIIIKWYVTKKDAYKSEQIENYKIYKEELTCKVSNKPGKAVSIFNRVGNKVNYGDKFSKNGILNEVENHISVVRLLNLVSEKNNPYRKELTAFNNIIKTPVFGFSNLEPEINSGAKDYRVRAFLDEITNEIIRIEKTNKFNILKSALKILLKIDDILIYKHKNNISSTEEKMVMFSYFKKEKIITEFSNGSTRLIALVIKIVSWEQPIILIEEPENSIHPKTLTDLIKFINSFSEEKQFIIASHSLTLLYITDPKHVIVSHTGDDGMSEFSNVSAKKIIIRKLKKSYMDFSEFIPS